MVPFAALTMYPEAVRRMALFVALAPVSYLGCVAPDQARRSTGH
jgi:hypothetical protein